MVNKDKDKEEKERKLHEKKQLEKENDDKPKDPATEGTLCETCGLPGRHLHRGR